MDDPEGLLALSNEPRSGEAQDTPYREKEPATPQGWPRAPLPTGRCDHGLDSHPYRAAWSFLVYR